MTEYQCENEVFRPKCVVVKEVIYVVTFKEKIMLFLQNVMRQTPNVN